jgi:hypothetical protein
MDKKNILMIAFTDLEGDPRVRRHIMFLKDLYRITTIGFTSPGIDGVDFFPVEKVPNSKVQRLIRAVGYKLRRFETLYWNMYRFEPLLQRLRHHNFDLIVANDVETLPFALRIAGKAPVLLDTHEYSPRQFEDRWLWREFFQPFNRYLCKTYMGKCQKIVTVSPGVARAYKEEFGVDVGVLSNAAPFYDAEPSAVDPDHIRIVSHGVSNPNRRLETMIETMDYVDRRFSLDLMLLPTDRRYYGRLCAVADKRENVRIIPPVKVEEIIPSTIDYDLSNLVFPPTTINFRYGLFNKFFESLQARLGIISGPTPESHVEYIRQFDCGLVTSSYEPAQVATAINRLTTGEIQQFKANSGVGARELTAEKNRDTLINIVKQLVGEKV